MHKQIDNLQTLFVGGCCTNRPSDNRDSSVDFPALSKPMISKLHFLFINPEKKVQIGTSIHEHQSQPHRWSDG